MIDNFRNKVINGNALTVLPRLPENSIDMLITSPPYWRARVYNSPITEWGGDPTCKHVFNMITGKNIEKSFFCNKCKLWRGQLGQEPHPDMFTGHLVDIIDSANSCLKPEATIWVNIGDSYFKDNKHKDYKQDVYKQSSNKIKSSVGIPFRFALEMINRGYLLRNTIIWKKPDAFPSSVKDRFTPDFEYLFFFSINSKYHFEQQFDPLSPESKISINAPNKFQDYGNPTYSGFHYDPADYPEGRNKRCVWTISTAGGTKEKHYAVFPEKLIETPIKAGCPKEIDGKKGIVLDPFLGSGTTAIVSRKLGRDYIGIEINSKYIDIANKRYMNDRKARNQRLDGLLK